MFRAPAAVLAEDEKARVATGDDADPGLPTKLNACVQGALRGDPGALRAFLKAAGPTVRRICRGILGREHSELEDTIQECFIDVARALPHFRFESDVSHYVTKIVMRRAILARQRARRRSKQSSDLETTALAVFEGSSVPDARATLVRVLLDELNEAQATALLLRIMLGHSIDEIASITGVSVNTVKTRLRLGKAQLRRWMARSGEGRRARD